MAKLGDTKCKDVECIVCPFNSMAIGFCLDFNSNKTLNENLKRIKRYISETRYKNISESLQKEYLTTEGNKENE